MTEKRKPGRPQLNLTEAERKAKQNARVKQYRETHLEASRAYKRNWERDCAAKRAIAIGRKPGQKGPTPKVLTSEQRRAKQNARVKRWYAKNVERAQAIGAAAARNRRARIRGNGGTHTAADVAWLMEQQKGKCVFCLMSFGGEKPHVDHYLPLALGGANDRSNLRLLHKTCNLMKSAKHPAAFGVERGLLLW